MAFINFAKSEDMLCCQLAQSLSRCPSHVLADGAPAEVRSINKIAMERAGFSSDQIEMVKEYLKLYTAN